MYCCVREQRRDRKSKNKRNVTGEQATRRRDGAGRLIRHLLCRDGRMPKQMCRRDRERNSSLVVVLIDV